jgi:hypothetical protein
MKVLFFCLGILLALPVLALNSFEELARATRTQAAAKDQQLTYCPTSPTDIGEVEQLLRMLSITCSCKAWGDCPKEVCSCERLCPKNLDIFPPPKSGPEHSLAFGAKTDIRGLDRMTNQFNRLATFEASSTQANNLSSSDPEVQLKAVAFYREVIEKITNNYSTAIPGFSNLREFSSHPAIQSMLADQVQQFERTTMLSYSMLETKSKLRRHNPAAGQETLKVLKQRGEFKLIPQIIYQAKDRPGELSSALVLKVIKQGPVSLLCLAGSKKCERHIQLGSGGELELNDGGKKSQLQGFTIAPWDELDVVLQTRHLQQQCQQDKGCE